jgi:hypothetical protein
LVGGFQEPTGCVYRAAPPSALQESNLQSSLAWPTVPSTVQTEPSVLCPTRYGWYALSGRSRIRQPLPAPRCVDFHRGAPSLALPAPRKGGSPSELVGAPPQRPRRAWEYIWGPTRARTGIAPVYLRSFQGPISGIQPGRSGDGKGVRKGIRRGWVLHGRPKPPQPPSCRCRSLRLRPKGLPNSSAVQSSSSSPPRGLPPTAAPP